MEERPDLGRARADAGAGVLGALLGAAGASDLLRGGVPGPAHGVVGDQVFLGFAPHPGSAAPVVGLALVVAGIASVWLRRRLDPTLGRAGSLVAFLPGALAPAVVTGGLHSFALLAAGALLGLAAVLTRSLRARAPGGDRAPPDLDLTLLAFATGAAAGLGLASGHLRSPSGLLVLLAATGAGGTLAAAHLAGALARRHGVTYEEARPRALLALLPLCLAALTPWALGNAYEAPGFPDERRVSLVTALTLLALVLAALGAAHSLTRGRPPRFERDRTRLRRLFVFVVLPLAAASLSVTALPLDLDLVHLGERTSAASAVRAGAVPFRDIFMLKPLSDVAAPLAAFALYGQTVGAIFRFDALLAPLGAGAEALLAACVLPARFAGVVTAVRLAAPLRVLFGPYPDSLTPPHRFCVRDLALAALAVALGAERPRVAALAGATLLAAAGCVGGLDAAGELLAALAIGSAARILLRPGSSRAVLLGVGAPLALVLALTAAALAATGSLGSFVAFHRTALAALPVEYCTAFDPPSAGPALAIPLLAVRLYGPAAFALAALALVHSRRRSVGRGEIGLLLVATAVLAGVSAAMTRTDLAHLDGASRLAPVLLAFVALGAAGSFWNAADAAREAAPWVGLALVGTSALVPQALAAVARQGLTEASGRARMAAPRGHDVPLETSVAAGCDALLRAIARLPGGSLSSLPSAPLLNFLAERPSPSPFSLGLLTCSPWERRIVAHRLVAHPPSVVVILPTRFLLPVELRYPEVARLVWARFAPTTSAGGYLVLEPASPERIVASAPALDPATATIAAGGRDLGHVPESWGREALTTEVGAGPVIAAFPGPVARGALGGWTAQFTRGGALLRGAPIAPDSVGFIRAVIRGEGRGVLVFTSERAPAISAERSFGFAVTGPVATVLIPVGAFASWHWSGRIESMLLRGDGSPLEIASVELLAPFDEPPESR